MRRPARGRFAAEPPAVVPPARHVLPPPDRQDLEAQLATLLSAAAAVQAQLARDGALGQEAQGDVSAQAELAEDRVPKTGIIRSSCQRRPEGVSVSPPTQDGAS